ncbi:MAG: DEAD/DEAH box helicase [Desulfobacteraceae bacterium]|jgi:ATP-dependent RNA helicase RhlB|nr:DEAD/DEAH box helicase [Desulfobacteraceae bacterium]
MNEDPEPTEEISRATEPTFLTDVRFDAFDLPPEVAAGIQDAGFTHCTPIQAQTLPIALAGKDVAGQAQTGTGKTAAFLITIFTRLLADKDRKPGTPTALIVAPTRELARQIHEEAAVIGGHTPFKAIQVVGGVDYGRQAEQLKEGVDIITCTPGRIIDYQKQGIFQTSGIRTVVIDEADRLLDMGFAKDMRYILRNLPRYDVRQSLLFSATMAYRVLELTYEYMNLPEFVSVAPDQVTVEGIEQTLHHVGKEKKLSLLLGLLNREEVERCLIFVNTKAGVEWLAKKLKGNGFPAEGITGDIPQRKRFRLMEQFKNGKLKMLVATDVASRGIHVEDVSHVVNYDLPQDAENYVHRIGRTARAGKTGRAISLACEDYVYHLEPLEEMLGYKLPVVWPQDEWFEPDHAGPVGGRTRKGKSRKLIPGEKGGRGYRRGKPAPSRPPDYFPGTFFGFAPPQDAKIKDSETKESIPAEAATPAATAKKKRRRARRKRKRSPQTEGGGEAGSSEGSES